MPYTSPPTFVDGNLLSASQLNTLGDDVAFLAGIASGVNIPFNSITSGVGSGIDQKWRIRHLHRYFHWKLRQITGTDDSLEVRYDGTAVYSDGGNRTAPYTWSGYIDLNATPGGLTIGDWYELSLAIVQAGSGVTVVDYLLESPSTTL